MLLNPPKYSPLIMVEVRSEVDVFDTFKAEFVDESELEPGQVGYAMLEDATELMRCEYEPSPFRPLAHQGVYDLIVTGRVVYTTDYFGEHDMEFEETVAVVTRLATLSRFLDRMEVPKLK